MMARGLFLGSILLIFTTLLFSQTNEISKRLGLGTQSELSDSKIETSSPSGR